MMEAVPIPSNLELFDRNGATEDSAALLFLNLYRDRLLYCHTEKCWFEFDGYTWKKHKTPQAFHYIREMMRGVDMRIKQITPNAPSKTTVKFCTSVEIFARSSPLVARTLEDWNRDKYLLGTPGGTINLRTGVLEESNPADMISRRVAVAPDIEFEDCPNWEKFLDEATNKDEGLKRFLQQIAGYALTGDVSEQCLFFIYGQGGRGKGVFINTLLDMMGDYGVNATMEAFEKQGSSQHTTDLAMLNGARLVTASETEAGAAWNEKRIKAITGEDRITARFMRQDNIEFDSTFTLLIIGNHKPTINTVDDAIRRRFNIIPFTVKPKRKDSKLKEKLKREYPGILLWAMRGCLDWQKNGLVRPASVLKATAEYFEEQNTLGHWMQECCRVEVDNKHLSERSSALFESWKKYAAANGVPPGDARAFKASLEREEITIKKTKLGNFYEGITLRSADE